SELFQLARQPGQLAAQSRDHAFGADAIRRADRGVWQASRCCAREFETADAGGPDLRAYVRSAVAGRREYRLVYEESLRSDRARGDHRFDRFLGMALGLADGDFDTGHARDDVRLYAYFGAGSATGFNRHVDHCARATC